MNFYSGPVPAGKEMTDTSHSYMRSVMSIMRRLKNSLGQQGFSTTLYKIYILAVDYWFDLRYRVETCQQVQLHDLAITSGNKERGNRYQASRVVPLRKLFPRLKPLISSDAVLVDFGCGKGRVLVVASEFGFREVRGVEFAPELCAIARKNCAAYKRATGVATEFQVSESDVVDYRINSDESVFFMYNPFDGFIVSKVLNNIATSLAVNSRKIIIVYYEPRFSDAIEQKASFSKLFDLNFRGYPFSVYANHD